MTGSTSNLSLCNW